MQAGCRAGLRLLPASVRLHRRLLRRCSIATRTTTWLLLVVAAGKSDSRKVGADRVNYDVLDRGYWQSQVERVVALRDKISARPNTESGRAVPDDEDLVIGQGRRLQLAVMFIDISSFSSRPSESAQDQEMMLRVLNLFFTEMIKIAEDYGGTIEKNTGDGLMAYFEADGSETASKRALSCALTMMHANQNLIRPILVNTGVEPIRFRVSIDAGYVTVARIGAARRFNANVAIGTTANFAAKMLARAAADEIVLGDLAYNDIPFLWRLEHGELVSQDTGWVYVGNRAPYALYRFKGRWVPQ